MVGLPVNLTITTENSGVAVLLVTTITMEELLKLIKPLMLKEYVHRYVCSIIICYFLWFTTYMETPTIF